MLFLLQPKLQRENYFAENSTQASVTFKKITGTGWDDRGMDIYHSQKENLTKLTHSGLIHEIKIFPSAHSLRVVATSGFWSRLDGQFLWEKSTFVLFFQYLNSDTTLVDFGTW